MKHTSFYIICSILTSVFLAGCSKPGSQLIGAWSSHDDFNYGQQRCEFFKDNSGFLEEGQRLSATWSALDDGRLKIIVTMGGGPGITMFANVTGDELFLDEGGNRRIAYVREGSPKATEIQASINKARSEREVLIEAEKRAQAERYAAQQREEARQREAERVAQAQRQESDRVAREREQEAKRANDAGNEAQNRGLYQDAINEFQRASQFGDPEGTARALNNLAWLYATCKDSTQHNGKKAVELALQATKLKPQETGYFDTLAAAYARNGQFDQAVSTQVRVLSMGYVNGGEDRLKLYRQRKAYQEPN